MFFEQTDFVMIDQITVTVVELGNELYCAFFVICTTTFDLSDVKA